MSTAPTTLNGTNATAVLDSAAGTLTFTYTGSAARMRGGNTAPIVIPLGAIAAVDSADKLWGGHFRVVLHNRYGWKKDPAADPQGMVVVKGAGVNEFADLVRQQVAATPPVPVPPHLQAPSPDDPRPPKPPKEPGLIMSFLGNENW